MTRHQLCPRKDAPMRECLLRVCYGQGRMGRLAQGVTACSKCERGQELRRDGLPRRARDGMRQAQRKRQEVNAQAQPPEPRSRAQVEQALAHALLACREAGVDQPGVEFLRERTNARLDEGDRLAWPEMERLCLALGLRMDRRKVAVVVMDENVARLMEEHALNLPEGRP